ncbi:superinfection exclusion B family protein [Bacillus haynesii]|nr:MULTISPECIES: super-infection exclusion protein B [Bacillus]ARC67877.1 hypothetical protein B34_00434 [Bacillus licheniformis]MCY9290920.1 superinfection exclusion B family protein [Bacillus haynesii]MDE1421384.1 super-infection exclusion protein B [Bacillus licheniformis]
MSDQNEKSPSWISDIIKLGPKYLIALAIFSGVSLLLGNIELGEQLGVREAINNFKLYLGLLFLASTSFLMAHGLWGIWIKIKNVIDYRSRYKIQRERLRNLNRKEKQLLAPFIFDNIRSRELSIADGTVKELELLQIIYRSSSIGSSRGMVFAYNLQPRAREYLMKNKHLLHEPIDHVL